ncbi:MAG: carbon-nitrogen hydrolase family protein [Elusimicrobia bacterium]|nr:carbon-nitrogen hydrolase family protein [Elusimicrobiota bacterium]
MKNVNLCGVQIEPILCDLDASMKKSVEMIEKCVDEYSADLIVFPETVATGFITGLDAKELRKYTDEIPGKTTEAIQEAARKNKTHVVWTTYEPAPDGKLYNSAVLIDPKGDVLGVYRKVHPFPAEYGWTAPGNKVEVFKTDIGNIGMIICFDGDFAELARIMAKKNVHIIARPSAFLRSFDVWELTNAARAYDSRAYLVGVNYIGKDKGPAYYYGHSMIVSPQGRRLAQALSREEIIHAEVDWTDLDYASFGSNVEFLADNIKTRNEEAYKDILD